LPGPQLLAEFGKASVEASSSAHARKRTKIFILDDSRRAWLKNVTYNEASAVGCGFNDKDLIQKTEEK
jgi:hypothetical protein